MLTKDYTNITSKNELCITGWLQNSPRYRVSPANLETAHFRLWHESSQDQVFAKLDLKRKVEFSVAVSVAQSELISKLKSLDVTRLGVNKVLLEATGYLAHRVYSNGEKQLVLHAKHIEIL